MKLKVTVSVDEGLLFELDALVQDHRFESRSAAMEAGVQRLLEAEVDAQFGRALDALTPEDLVTMEAMAEQGMADWSEQLREYPW